jgi:hypothetical protein
MRFISSYYPSQPASPEHSTATAPVVQPVGHPPAPARGRPALKVLPGSAGNKPGGELSDTYFNVDKWEEHHAGC